MINGSSKVKTIYVRSMESPLKIHQRPTKDSEIEDSEIEDSEIEDSEIKDSEIVDSEIEDSEV